MPAPLGPPLVLVPTPLERGALEALGGCGAAPRAELCGFGPVAAAARTAGLIAERRPRSVWLVGLAGALADLVPGQARAFTRVRLDGVGIGRGPEVQPASSAGFPLWEDERVGRIEELLELGPDGSSSSELLTVCAASATPAEAQARRARYPAALAEDMEGFGVAFACRLAGVPLTIVRGMSNRAGERNRREWRVEESLAAARTLLLRGLAEEHA